MSADCVGNGENEERQTRKLKGFVERSAELFNNGLVTTRESVALYVTIIAVLALLSARLWIGAAAVTAAFLLRHWFALSDQKNGFRNERFRRRYRELLAKAESTQWDFTEMLAEDRAFLQKYEDSILYPWAVPEHERDKVTALDLQHVETLYREYFPLPHIHSLQQKDCKLCAAAQRVKEHFEGAISKLENTVESACQALVTRIDGRNAESAIHAKDLLPAYCAWESWLSDGAVQRQDKVVPFPLLRLLRDKEQWTFEEADKVRELCREDKKRIGDDLSGALPFEVHIAKLFDALSQEIENTTGRFGLAETWKWYDQVREGKEAREKSFALFRRAIARHNAEAVFLELAEGPVTPAIALESSARLSNYGFDFRFVQREVQAARKLIAKERGEKWEKCYQRELRAAQNFAWLEEAVKEQRFKEYGEEKIPGETASWFVIVAKRAFVFVVMLLLLGVWLDSKHIVAVPPVGETTLRIIGDVGIFLAGLFASIFVFSSAVDRVRGWVAKRENR